MSYSYTASERFLRYVQIDTQSDPYSESFPSTEKQKEFIQNPGTGIKRDGHFRS